MLQYKLSKILEILGHKLSPTNYISRKERKYNIWGKEIILPPNHPLQQLVHNFPKYQRNLQQIADLLFEKNNSYNFIDIGANIGDTAQLLNENSKKEIYSIEGDEFYFKYLIRNSIGDSNIKPHNFFLSDEINKSVAIRVENGTGVPYELDNNVSTKSTTSELITLDDLFDKLNLSNVCLVKIDTDGFDLKILMGGCTMIAKEKPILFIEIDPYQYGNKGYSFEDVSRFLVNVGYSNCIWFDYAGGEILRSSLSNFDISNQLINYVSKKNNLIPYYDLAIFPENHIDIFEKIVK